MNKNRSPVERSGNIPFERRDSSLSAPLTDEMHKPGSIYSSAILLACVSLIAVHAVSVRSEAQHGNTPTASLPIRDDFNTGNLNAWEMPFPEDWGILKEGSIDYLHMKRNRAPGVPRRPLQFARLRGVEVGSFILMVEVRRAGGSMIVVFNYVDTLHFYYVHLSENPGTEMAVTTAYSLLTVVTAGGSRAWMPLRRSQTAPGTMCELYAMSSQALPRFF